MTKFLKKRGLENLFDGRYWTRTSDLLRVKHVWLISALCGIIPKSASKAM